MRKMVHNNTTILPGMNTTATYQIPLVDILPTTTSPRSFPTLLSIYFCFGCVSFFGHSLVSWTIFHHMTLNYAPYHLLINLGLCDIGYSLIGMLMVMVSMATNSTMEVSQSFCRVSFAASIFTSSCLAYDRVLSVKNLFRYQHIAQKKVPLLMITFSWAAALFCQFIIMIFEYSPSSYVTIANGAQVPVRVTAAAVMSLTITSNSIFIVYCLLHARNVAQQELSRLRGLTRYLHGETAELYFSLARRQKLNNDVTVVSIFSLATLVPANITYMKMFLRPAGSNNTPLLLFNWMIGAVYCAINPFVYLRWMRKLKRCFVKDFARVRRFIKTKRNVKIRPN